MNLLRRLPSLFATKSLTRLSETMLLLPCHTAIQTVRFTLIGTRMTSPLDKIADTDIDVGRFKYVLIKVHHSPEGGPEISKHIVRGYCSAEYHADVYERVAPGIEKQELDCECVGGGRILHDADNKTIEVFGYSQGYGKADHSISVEILKKKYPDYAKITFSNDGY